MSRAGSWTRSDAASTSSARCPRWARRPTRSSRSQTRSRPRPTPASSTCCSRRVSASRAPSWRWRSTISATRPSRYTGSQAGILTDAAHTQAKIREIRGDRIRGSLEQGKIVLVAGFQGFSRDTMEITTLGRGGTDATAVALAAALGGACEIYSDVAGVYTADPRIVPEARKLPSSRTTRCSRWPPRAPRC